MKYIILSILVLTLAQCVVPYDQYTVQTVQTAKGTTVTKPVTVINVQRAPRYYTPNYRYYTRPYLNCAPHYYRRHYSRYWGCY